jgi:ABC-type dipeptide/oligopeptide/nickel transport system permease subunit
VGCLSGYFGGRLDFLVAALINMLLTLPGLILTLAILGVLGTGPISLLLALIGGEWAGQARIIRAAVLEVRAREYVEAARVIGAGRFQILRRHILPNVAGVVAILATLDLGSILLTVTSLSFLGIGVQPPHADWGTLISDSRPYLRGYPGLLLLPMACVMIYAVLANLAGDALRDRLDPFRR